MNKAFIFIIFLASCSPVKQYKLIVTVEDRDLSGLSKLIEIKDMIQQTNDSLAYFNGSAQFLVYRNSFDLNGYQMSMGKPVSFKVLNEKGTDITQLLGSNAIKCIDAYHEEHYNRSKPLIEKRKKKMLEQLNEN